MMRTYLRRAYRLRRIATLVCCGLFLQWLSNYIKWGQHPGYDLAYVIGYMDFYVGLAACALIGALIFPSFACSIVVAIVGVLVAAPVFLTFYDLFRSLPTPVTFGLCLLLFYVCFYLVFRPTLDRFLPHRPATFRTVATTPLGKDVVWDGFYSVPPDADKRYNAKDIIAFSKEPDTENTYRLRERIWNMAQFESLMTLHHRDRPNAADHSWTSLDLPETHELRQFRTDNALTDLGGGGTRIAVTWHLERTTLRSRFALWILDHLGTTQDLMLSKLEKARI